MSEISINIMELRKSNNMSQEELAEKLFVSRQAISKWERGEALPDINNLAALAKLFNVSIDYIVNGEAEACNTSHPINPLDSNNDAAIKRATTIVSKVKGSQYLSIRCQMKRYQDLIFHSDRGVQYASYDFQDALKLYKMRQSMSRKGDPYDDAVAENFFQCFKCEKLYLLSIPNTRKLAKLIAFQYIEGFYNRRRRHSSIGYYSPLEYKQLYYAS